MRYATLVIGGFLAAVCAQGAAACGYHAGLADSAFDVVHPRSLGVAVAVRQATDGGVLRTSQASTGLPDLFGGDYRRAVRQLQTLEQRLTPATRGIGEEASWDFSFVFVRSRLWTRYSVRADGVSARIHAPAADDGEAVVLSDERVLGALLDGRLAFAAAVEQGLLQFANDPDGKAFTSFRTALEGD